MSYQFKNKLHFIGKTATSLGQMTQDTGKFSAVELQLLNDYKEHYTEIENSVLNIVQSKKLNIEVLRSPLAESGDNILGEITLEYILNDAMYQTMRNTFRFAQKLAEVNGKPMKVVVHFTSNFEIYKYQTYVYDELCRRLYSILKEYPDTIACVENYVPYCLLTLDKGEIPLSEKYGDIDCTKSIVPKGGFHHDNVKLVKDFITRFPEMKGHVGVTIDTCHAMLAQRFDILAGLDHISNTPSLEECFEVAGELCQVIHLNNYVGDGLTESHHSVKFRERDRKLLTGILSYIDQYTPTASITLELIERDYSKDAYEGKRETLELIEDIIGIDHMR